MAAISLAGVLTSYAAVETSDFDDIKLYTLKNSAGTTVKITNYGATVTSILTADRKGKMADIVLGYSDVSGYMNAVDKAYLGAIVGRYGNRIAKGFTPVDSGLIPSGKIALVSGTPFDFTTAKAIGRDIGEKNQQLEYGLGYDHNWVLDKGENNEQLTLAATLFEPSSGRFMEVFTKEPGLQFYCGNFLAGNLHGKSGKTYVHRGGLCLETQHYPDSPNQSAFPNTILNPDEKYTSTTVYKFSTK